MNIPVTVAATPFSRSASQGRGADVMARYFAITGQFPAKHIPALPATSLLVAAADLVIQHCIEARF
jgi:hypothetical protein